MNINDNLMINLKNNLFNENSIKKYTNNFILTPQKRVKLERYIERVQNNEFKGETKGYPAFLKFLEDILDYEEDKHIKFDDNPDIGQDRVEFALNDENGKFMVIELKGSNVDLDKPQNRVNDKRTPIKQAFGYAEDSTKQSGLVSWILVSNYKEFRLYHYENRAGEYISFNVEDLLNDDIFKTFMFAFSKESHIDLKAINDVVNENYIEKTQLANNFYKLFNETRLMIFKELNELHGMDKKESISNAQTILDRFIFICFASSRELLPENIARKTLMNRIKNEDIRDHEIWRDLNYLFIDVDIGNDDRNISKYNGGLFKDNLEDIKLKDIIKDTNFFKDVYQKWNFKEFEERLKKEIKPSILKRVNSIYINLLIISYFDFSEENNEDNKHKLDIEILGHIFENSIGDIEELKEDSKGRRKKDGIFYTPDYITDYICKNTIIPYLSISGNVNTVEGLLEEYSTGREIEKLDPKLKKIRIVDPACGSGAFLNKATDILLDIHEGIYEIKKGYKTSTSMRVGTGKRRRTENVQHMDIGVYVFDALSKRREILLNNIYGVDLNSESVEITKLSLFLKVCEKGKILPAIDKNILCGNSLIDDPKFTDKPLNWKQEFKEIFQSGGFDIVIGNPPYVVLSSFKDKEFKFLQKTFKTTYGRLNTFAIFIEQITNLIKDNGKVGLIIPDSLCLIDYYTKLRKFLLDNYSINVLIELGNGIFADATVPALVIIFSEKTENNLIRIGNKDVIYESSKFRTIKQDNYLKTPKFSLNLHMDDLSFKLNNLIDYENVFPLKELIQIKIGVCTGGNNKHIAESSIFNNSKKVLQGRNIGRYTLDFNNKYLNYDRDQLLRARDEGIFLKKEKLLMRQTSDKLILTYDNSQYYVIDSLFVLYSKNNDLNLKYSLSLLNSKLLNRQYQKLNPETGRVFAQVKIDYVNEIPLFKLDEIEQNPFIEKADKMISLKEDLVKEINGFKNWLQREPYNIDKFSKKLDKYYELSFEDFLIELKKKRVDTKLRKTQELLKNEFEESINVINPLLQQINGTDSEIDQMVYDLYGLTNEEIKIIENNI
jgi:type I restriction-modification system DNA methylase subunit